MDHNEALGILLVAWLVPFLATFLMTIRTIQFSTPIFLACGAYATVRVYNHLRHGHHKGASHQGASGTAHK